MRSWLSTARRSFTVAGVVALTAVGLVAAGGATAQAALAPVVGCGFHFGPISEQGATGTLFYSAVLEPANPAQRCTTAVSFDVSAAPVAGGTYSNIGHNPLGPVSQTVSFAPGRLGPVLTIAWQLFHCADPAVPGRLTFAAAGQAASIGITPGSCAGMSPSNFMSFPIPQASSEVGIAPTHNNQGYRTVNDAGALTHEGNATAFAAAASNFPVVGMTPAPTGNGAWVVASDGGVFAYGSAAFHGSTGAMHLNQPIVGMASTPSGHGYWLVASDGGVFSFGDAVFHGSTGAIHLNSPVVGMAAAPDGHGYWLTALDGGVFAFGSAHFAGSLGSTLLNAPIVAMAANPHAGYWLVGSDGAVYAFGGAPFRGSLGASHLSEAVSGVAPTSTGNGYWLMQSDNHVHAFGDAHFFGDAPITR